MVRCDSYCVVYLVVAITGVVVSLYDLSLLWRVLVCLGNEDVVVPCVDTIAFDLYRVTFLPYDERFHV